MTNLKLPAELIGSELKVHQYQKKTLQNQTHRYTIKMWQHIHKLQDDSKNMTNPYNCFEVLPCCLDFSWLTNLEFLKNGL